MNEKLPAPNCIILKTLIFIVLSQNVYASTSTAPQEDRTKATREPQMAPRAAL